MHIYHYAPYEASAIKRLMGLHGTREDEVDRLLRGEVLVDLYAVVRQGVRIGQPSYSIKSIEAFYMDRRDTDVADGGDSIVAFERFLETGDRSLLESIERYNEDDCRSTRRLREWLLARRAEAIATFGREIPWKPAPDAREPDRESQEELDAAAARAPRRDTRRQRRSRRRSTRRLADGPTARLPPARGQAHVVGGTSNGSTPTRSS